MVDWEFFKKNIFSQNQNIGYELIQLDVNNQLGLFFHKNSPIVFFGFIKNSSEDSLLKMIESLNLYAVKNGFKKIIGPIDGATWNHYRFQDHIEILQPYPGEPTYPQKSAQVFLDQGFNVAEKYETILIQDLVRIQNELAPFHQIELPEIHFVQPTPEIFSKQKSEFQDLINQIFKQNIQFTELSLLEIDIIFSEIQKTIHYETSVLALNSDQKVVGFMLNYIQGQTLCFKTIGFLHQYRYQGLSLFKMLNFLFDQVKKSSLKLDQIIICLMRKNNFPSLISADLVLKTNSYILLEKEL